MSININNTTSFFQFENRESLRNTAKNILQKSSTNEQLSKDLLNKTIFEQNNSLKEYFPDTQMFILKSSTQGTLSNTLKETQKYLKKHSVPNENKKKYVLGEILGLESLNEELSYTGELANFEIDKNTKNIFIAA